MRPPRRNSWSRNAAPRPESQPRPAGDLEQTADWRLEMLSAVDGDDPFREAHINPLVRFLSVFAKSKMFFLLVGFALVAAAIYFLANPTGAVAGLPVGLTTIALAALAVILALCVTLGAWLRQIESVEDAVAVMTVPVIAIEKGAKPDVH